LIGEKYGRWTIVGVDVDRTDEDPKRATYVKCECECGTKKSIRFAYLKCGKTKSCGCLQKERVSETSRKDLTGMKFGKLTALYPIENRTKKREVQWLCECECGEKIVVTTYNLSSGNVSSCGCIVSKNEEKIKRILINNNVRFKQQYTVSDLINPKTNCRLRFDFAIFDKDNCLVMFIEYDGIQHFQVVNFSSNKKKNKERLLHSKETDKIKNEYCKRNSFSLFRIPYTHENEVEKLVLGALKEKGLIERND